MADKPDDLDAVRAIADMLAQFEATEQERIIRWAKERVGLPIGSPPRGPASGYTGAPAEHTAPETPAPLAEEGTATDIKSFMEQKKPASDTDFAAAVAYYYRFEAPVPDRRETIGKDDLLEACRLAGRGRSKRPAQTLVNAHRAGVLDKAERGQYSINTVGENLVAITLPSADASGSAPRRRTTAKKKAKNKAGAKKNSGRKKAPSKESSAKTAAAQSGKKG